MPALDWAKTVIPNYPVLAPALIVVATMLVIMVADFYVSEKKTLMAIAFIGTVFAMLGVWFGSGDATVRAALDAGKPVEFWGNMLVADNFTFFLSAVLLGAVGLVILLSSEYVAKFLKGMYVEFYEVLLSALLGMMFMVSSRDLITIYVGLELTSISSYILAGLLRKDAKSNEAALKYFLNGALASAVLLFGLSIIYGVTGTTYLPAIGSKLLEYAGQANGVVPLTVAGVIFMAGGFSFKIAAVPMHLWAPDAYEGAPTPVTAFFSVGPKGAAFGAILRVFLVGVGATQFSDRWMIIWSVLATASMFVGNLTALMQTNIKRMMAYSSIAQAGYILVGVVAAGKAPLGSAAVLYYLLAYAMTNLGIFAVLTHMDHAGGWVNIKDFNGLAKRNPWYAWALLLFFLSLIGIPPTVGFMGKFFLLKAAVQGQYLWLALVMAVNSVISVGYYYGVVKAMFLEPTEKETLPVQFGTMATVVVCFVGVILVGILAGPFIDFTTSAATMLLK